MAQPVARARLLQQIRRSGHVLRAPGNDYIRIATLNGLRGQRHRFEPGPADLVDRRGRRSRAKARSQTDLAGHILAQACADHVAEDDFTHFVCRNSGALERRFDDAAAQGWAQGQSQTRRRKRRWPCARRLQINFFYHIIECCREHRYMYIPPLTEMTWPVM